MSYKPVSFRKFKKENENNEGRKAIFIAVSLDGENTSDFKNNLDKK